MLSQVGRVCFLVALLVHSARGALRGPSSSWQATEPVVLAEEQAIAVLPSSDATSTTEETPLAPRLRLPDDDNVPGVVVELCECEQAVGEPGGLTCTKEGWFVSSFENQGTWMGGGGLVPLSHAICCRPCLPTTLPAGTFASTAAALPAAYATGAQNETLVRAKAAAAAAAAGVTRQSLPSKGGTHGDGTASSIHMEQPTEVELASAATPVAVVSFGCHPSSGKAFSALTCESSGHSFVTGFTQAQQVSSFYPDVFYPVGSVSCCTPSLLLSTGEVLPLERCNCVEAYSKDCGAMVTHRLLWGFNDWRINRDGQFLPVAPLECCQACLPAQPAPGGGSDCRELGMCSGTGVCVQGACACYEGWGGSDCSVSQHSGMDYLLDLPWWAMCLVFLGLGLCICTTSVAARATWEGIYGSPAPAGGNPLTVLASGRRRGSNNSTSLGTPLLYTVMDDAGSAGSQDTDDLDDVEGLDGEAEESAAAGAGGEGHTAVAAAESDGVQTVVETAAAAAAGASQGGAVDEAWLGQSRSAPAAAAGAAELADGGRAGEQLRSARQTMPRLAPVPRRNARLHVPEPSPADVAAIPSDAAHPVALAVSGAGASEITPGGGTTAVSAAAAAVGAAVEGDAADECELSAPATSPTAGDAALAASLAEDEGRREGGGPTCVVCMEAPIQVVLVPCGHAGVCRRCSRRLTHCPLCRRMIHRRQRLFMGVD